MDTVGLSADSGAGRVARRSRSGTRWLAVRRWGRDAYGFLHIGPSGLAATIPLAGAATGIAEPTVERLVALLPVAICFHLFAFLVNDVCDLEVDRTQPLRANDPLVRGAISPRTVLWIAMAQVPVSIGITIALGGRASALAAIAAALMLMAVYDVWGKRAGAPMLLDFIQGVSWAALAWYGASMSGGPAAHTAMLAAAIVVYVMMTNGIHGPLRDLANDFRHRVSTTAIILGARPTGHGITVRGPSLALYAIVLEALLVGLAMLAADGDARSVVAVVALASIMALVWSVRVFGDHRMLMLVGSVHILVTLGLILLPFVLRLHGSAGIAIGAVFAAPVVALLVRNTLADR